MNSKSTSNGSDAVSNPTSQSIATPKFSSKREQLLKDVNTLQSRLKKLTDNQLKNAFNDLRVEAHQAGRNDQTLAAQALAFGSEATARVLGIELYDCLLYTSPSPRDATLSRMPSSA